MSIQEKINYFKELNEASVYDEIMKKHLWKIQEPGLLRHRIYESAADALRGISKQEMSTYQHAGRIQQKRFYSLLFANVLNDGSPESRFLFEPFVETLGADVKSFVENGGEHEKGIELLEAINMFAERFNKHARNAFSQEEETVRTLQRQGVPTKEIVSKHAPTFVPGWAASPQELLFWLAATKRDLETLRDAKK